MYSSAKWPCFNRATQSMSERHSSQKGVMASKMATLFVAIVFAVAGSTAGAVTLSPSQPVQPLDASRPIVSELVASASRTDAIVVQFAMPKSVSLRDQYINMRILRRLLRDQASRQSDVKPCQLDIRSRESFPSLEMVVTHATATQRDDCLRGAIRYLLDEPIGEADFLAARQTEAEWRALWTAPRARYEGIAIDAVQRLAYLAIYQERSPLYQLNSVTARNITEHSFDAFSIWLATSRENKLMTFHATAGVQQILGLSAPDSAKPRVTVSLVSSRSPVDIAVFDGEQFGAPALIMVSVDPDYPTQRLFSSAAWRRFSCNRDRALQVGSDVAVSAISGITCFWDRLFATDAWLGFVVTKSSDHGYAEFCRQVKALANHPDIASLPLTVPKEAGGMYVLLPSRCESPR